MLKLFQNYEFFFLFKKKNLTKILWILFKFFLIIWTNFFPAQTQFLIQVCSIFSMQLSWEVTVQLRLIASKQLKSAAGAGLLTLNSTCRVIRDFKISYLKLHERCIVKGKLNRKRPLPLQREKNLTEILSNFSDLDSENQVKKVIDTCFEIGNLTKTIKSSNILKRQKNLIPVVTTEEDLELDLISADESSSDENYFFFISYF